MKFSQAEPYMESEFVRVISALAKMDKEYLVNIPCVHPCVFADIQDVAVCKNELFCLHLSGKVSHLSLLSVERCVERLLRRGLWNLAARTCCLFQNSVIASRVSQRAYLVIQVVKTSRACRIVLPSCLSLSALSI